MKPGMRILGAVLVLVSAMIGSFSPIASPAVTAEPDIRSGEETWVGTKTGPEFVPDEIVVRFRAGVPAQTIEAINRSHGAATVKVGARSGLYRIRLPKGANAEAVAAAYKGRPEVAAASRLAIARAFAPPDDPYYRYQWNMENPTTGWGGVNWQAVWERSDRPKAAGVPVAIIDTGVAYNNPNATDLKGYANFLILNGSDLVNNDNDPSDDHGHGTHVAGTVAQGTNNSRGVVGVASGATIVPIKVLDNTGTGTEADVVEGIYMAIGASATTANSCTFDSTAPPARVINMSLGMPVGTTLDQLPGLKEALDCALARDVVVVAAAGNDASATDVAYPAKYPTAIAVGATTIDEKYAWYSNEGADVDVVAPGGEDCSGSNQLYCTILGINPDKNGDGYADGILQQTFAMGSDPNNSGNWAYYFLQGTSMASPHAAATAALVRGVNPGLSAADVRAVLEQTGRKLGLQPDNPGLIDAAAAVQRAVDLLGGTNNPPVANAGPDQTANEGSMVAFNGSGSSDADGSIVSYSWSYGDGTGGTGVTASHAYADNGIYTVNLTVTDNQGATATDSAMVTINNVAPTAEAGGPYSGSTGQSITFNGSATDPGTADTRTYAWNFGDGNTGAGATPSHTYSAAGTYTAILTVTDDDGGVGTDTSSVTVSAPATVANVAIAMSKQVSSKRWTASAAVTLRSQDASGPPMAGATVYGSWSGVYKSKKDVSGTTDSNGQVVFKTPSLNRSGTATFTVTRVRENNQDITMTGTTSSSISN